MNPRNVRNPKPTVCRFMRRLVKQSLMAAFILATLMSSESETFKPSGLKTRCTKKTTFRALLRKDWALFLEDTAAGTCKQAPNKL